MDCSVDESRLQVQTLWRNKHLFRFCSDPTGAELTDYFILTPVDQPDCSSALEVTSTVTLQRGDREPEPEPEPEPESLQSRPHISLRVEPEFKPLF